MAGVAEKTVIAGGGGFSFGTSTDDIFADKDLEKWTPKKINAELEKTTSVVENLLKATERQLTKTGTLPDYTSLFEQEMVRLRRISQLAQGFLQSQRKKETSCLSFGMQESMGVAHRLAAASFWVGAAFEGAMLSNGSSSASLITAATSCASVQTVFGNVTAFLGSRLSLIEGEIGEAIRIDVEARETLERITASLANWRIKAERRAAESEEAFQLEDQVHVWQEEVGSLPEREMLVGWLSGYSKAVLEQLRFTDTEVGRALTEALEELRSKNRAAQRIQRFRRMSSASKKESDEIEVVVDGGGALSSAPGKMGSRRVLFASPHEGDEPKGEPPNIGVTIGDWAKAVSEARRAIEMYVMFIAEQSESGAAGLVDFKKVIAFFREQLHIIDRALELADEEEIVRPTICGYEVDTILSWAFWGGTTGAASLSIWLDTSLKPTEEGNEFDEVRVASSMSLKLLAGVLQYAEDRRALVRKREEKRMTRLENLKREAKSARKFILAHLTRYRGFVDVPHPAGGFMRREAFEMDETAEEKAAYQGGAMAASGGGRSAVFETQAGKREGIESMVQKMKTFHEGEDHMTRRDYASLLVQQFRERYVDLKPDDFRPSCPEEMELFRAYMRNTQSLRSSSSPDGRGTFHHAPKRRGTFLLRAPQARSPGGFRAPSSALDEEIGAIRLPETRSRPQGLDVDALRAEVAVQGRPVLVTRMVERMRAISPDQKKEAAFRLVGEMIRYFPLLSMEDFRNIGDEDEMELLEAFFRVASKTESDGEEE